MSERGGKPVLMQVKIAFSPYGIGPFLMEKKNPFTYKPVTFSFTYFSLLGIE